MSTTEDSLSEEIAGARQSKDNVQVVCRFRPPNRLEAEHGAENVIEVVRNTTVNLDLSGLERQHAMQKAAFTFDRAFDPSSTQAEVFEHTAKPLADDIMKGFNCTVFAYGQTGSGKTHTMLGVPGTELSGIIPRLCGRVFDLIEDADENLEFTIKLSYVEIYMERIQDLLDESRYNLRIREGNRGVWIQDVTERYVSSVEEIMEIMDIGQSHRATASTQMNDQSSRSHSVFLLTLGQRNKLTGSKKGGKLILVDLAGSETVKKTGAQGSTLKEAQHINRSLSALGNVINALTSGSSHVPYRDSKLTRLLSDSLGGNSKTCLVVTCSPMSYNAEETLSTLRFGTRAKKIKNKPKINQEKSVGEYKALLAAAVAKCAEQEEIIAKLRKDIEALKRSIRNGDGIPADLQDLTEKEQKLAQHEETKSELSAAARRSSVVLHNLQLQGQMEFLQNENKEKEETIQQLQEEAAERDGQLEEALEELQLRDERIAKLQKDVFEQVAKSEQEAAEEAEQESRLRAELAEFEATKKRVAQLEQESEQYTRQISQLQTENMELAQLKEIHQSSLSALSTQPPPNLTPEQQRAYMEAQRAVQGPALTAADLTEAKVAQLHSQMEKVRSNYDVLMAALGRKCEQYVELQMQMQKQAERVQNMDRQIRAKDESAAQVDIKSQEKARQLEKRLTSSDQLCQKLFQSGVYWQKRAQRKDKELRDAKRRMAEREAQVRKMIAPDDPSTTLMDLAASTLRRGSDVGIHEASLSGGGRRPRGPSSGNLDYRPRTVSTARVLAPRAISGGRSARKKRAHPPPLIHQDSMDAFF